MQSPNKCLLINAFNLDCTIQIEWIGFVSLTISQNIFSHLIKSIYIYGKVSLSYGIGENVPPLRSKCYFQRSNYTKSNHYISSFPLVNHTYKNQDHWICISCSSERDNFSYLDIFPTIDFYAYRNKTKNKKSFI